MKKVRKKTRGFHLIFKLLEPTSTLNFKYKNETNGINGVNTHYLVYRWFVQMPWARCSLWRWKGGAWRRRCCLGSAGRWQQAPQNLRPLPPHCTPRNSPLFGHFHSIYTSVVPSPKICGISSKLLLSLRRTIENT